MLPYRWCVYLVCLLLQRALSVFSFIFSHFTAFLYSRNSNFYPPHGISTANSIQFECRGVFFFFVILCEWMFLSISIKYKCMNEQCKIQAKFVASLLRQAGTDNDCLQNASSLAYSLLFLHFHVKHNDD